MSPAVLCLLSGGRHRRQLSRPLHLERFASGDTRRRGPNPDARRLQAAQRTIANVGHNHIAATSPDYDLSCTPAVHRIVLYEFL